jgi:hypothetical protein
MSVDPPDSLGISSAEELDDTTIALTPDGGQDVRRNARSASLSSSLYTAG